MFCAELFFCQHKGLKKKTKTKTNKQKTHIQMTEIEILLHFAANFSPRVIRIWKILLR